MNKSICLLTALLLVELSLEGWGGSYRKAMNQEFEQKQSAVQSFPYSQDQGWFIDPNYLLWKPYLGELQYGLKATTENINTTDQFTKVRVKEPDFDWSSGVRLGVGRFLPNHDAWDISAYMTYVYVDTNSEIHADVNANQSFNPAYSYTNLVYSNSAVKTRGTWRVNYFVWDLMLGREFQMPSKMVFHPYVGLRAALIDQDFKLKAYSLEGDFFDTETQTLGYSVDDDFWALGLRVGSDFQFSLSRHWVLLGNLAASFLYGHDDININESATDTDTSVPGVIETEQGRVKSKDDPIHTNLEGYIGLGWEKWFRDGTVRLAPSILYEGSLWFNMNQILDQNTIFNQDGTFSQSRGNLGFMGLTFNLQVDF